MNDLGDADRFCLVLALLSALSPVLAGLNASSKTRGVMNGDGARLRLYTRSITSHSIFFPSISTPSSVDLSWQMANRGREDAMGSKRGSCQKSTKASSSVVSDTIVDFETAGSASVCAFSGSGCCSSETRGTDLSSSHEDLDFVVASKDLCVDFLLVLLLVFGFSTKKRRSEQCDGTCILKEP
jgi:hypothetical protein